MVGDPPPGDVHGSPAFPRVTAARLVGVYSMRVSLLTPEDVFWLDTLEREIERTLPSECSMAPVTQRSDKFPPVLRVRVDLHTHVVIKSGGKQQESSGDVQSLQAERVVDVALELVGIRCQVDSCRFSAEFYATSIAVDLNAANSNEQSLSGFQQAASINLFGSA